MITIVIKWVEEIDQPITSISFVLTEKNKKVWHSPGGKDRVVIFSPHVAAEHEGPSNVLAVPGLPQGKVGEAVAEIL